MSAGYRVEKWQSESPPDAEVCRRQMESEGFSVYKWRDGAGAAYSPHSHSNDQSHWIISGELELNVEGYGTVILKSGDRDFMPANTNHSTKVVENEAVVYLIGGK